MAGVSINSIASWDAAENVQKVANLIWDSNTLSWVKASGSTASGTSVEVNNFPASFGASQVGTWTVNAAQNGTWNVGLSAGTNNIGDVDVASITGTGSIAQAQFIVNSTSAEIIPARAGRRSLLIVNHGTSDVYLGTGTVTTGTGLLLTGTKGASISIPTSAAINGLVASGTQLISYIEVF